MSGSEFKVYKLSFTSMPVDHVALFVETESGNGELFHVIDGSASAGKYKQMKYDHKKGYNPAGSLTCSGTLLIGTVPKSKFGELKSICASTEAPGHPIPMRKNPNCITWLDNVLYKLKAQDVVTFNSSASVPMSEKILVIDPIKEEMDGKAGSSKGVRKGHR